MLYTYINIKVNDVIYVFELSDTNDAVCVVKKFLYKKDEVIAHIGKLHTFVSSFYVKENIKFNAHINVIFYGKENKYIPLSFKQ